MESRGITARLASGRASSWSPHRPLGRPLNRSSGGGLSGGYGVDARAPTRHRYRRRPASVPATYRISGYPGTCQGPARRLRHVLCGGRAHDAAAVPTTLPRAVNRAGMCPRCAKADSSKWTRTLGIQPERMLMIWLDSLSPLRCGLAVLGHSGLIQPGKAVRPSRRGDGAPAASAQRTRPWQSVPRCVSGWCGR